MKTLTDITQNPYPNHYTDSLGNPLITGEIYFAPDFNETVKVSFIENCVNLHVQDSPYNSYYEFSPSDFKVQFKSKKSKLILK